MALKLSVSTPSAETKTLSCSQEELVESIDAVSEASEALFACQADGAELCQVLDNLALTAEALENGGLSADFLKTFNSAGETCAAAGVEALTIEGLKALEDAQIKELQAKFAEGLEGKMAEYWAKFVQWLKNLWTKIKNWFTSLFVNRAKYVKALDAVAAMTAESYNADAKFQAWAGTEKAAEKVTKLDQAILATITKIEGGSAVDRKAAQADVDAMEKAMGAATAEKTVGSVYGQLPAFKATVKAYINVAKSTQLQKSSQKLLASLDKLTKEAGKAANAKDEEQGKLKEQISGRRDDIQFALMCIRVENRYVMKVGADLLKAFKAASTKKAAK